MNFFIDVQKPRKINLIHTLKNHLCENERKLTLDGRTNPILEKNLGDLFKELPKFLAQNKVLSVHLSLNVFTKETMNTLFFSLKDAPVRELCLGNPCSVETVSALFKALKSSHIETLKLEGNWLNDDTALIFSDGIKGTQLKELNLSQNFISEENARVLAHSFEGSLVWHVRLMGVDSKVGVAFVQTLSQTQVHKLAISIKGISTFYAHELKDALKNSPITDLDLSFNLLNYPILNILFKNLKSTQITHIHLDCNTICERAIKCIAQNLSGLKFLSLGANTVNDRGITILGKGIKQSNLETLNLINVGMTIEGLKSLLKEASLSKLKRLNIKENFIEIHSSEPIIQALKETKVIELTLSRAYMSQNAYEEIEMYLRKKRLTQFKKQFITPSLVTAFLYHFPNQKFNEQLTQKHHSIRYALGILSHLPVEISQKIMSYLGGASDIFDFEKDVHSSPLLKMFEAFSKRRWPSGFEFTEPPFKESIPSKITHSKGG